MEELKQLIEKGIVYEDDFIDTYTRVIRDEGFIGLFRENQEQANLLLSKLIEESGEHKRILENLKTNL